MGLWWRRVSRSGAVWRIYELLLASTLELAPPCWRQMLPLFLSIYHGHIITHARHHQIHDGISWASSPGSSTNHQCLIERGVDGSAAPTGGALYSVPLHISHRM